MQRQDGTDKTKTKQKVIGPKSTRIGQFEHKYFH